MLSQWTKHTSDLGSLHTALVFNLLRIDESYRPPLQRCVHEDAQNFAQNSSYYPFENLLTKLELWTSAFKEWCFLGHCLNVHCLRVSLSTCRSPSRTRQAQHTEPRGKILRRRIWAMAGGAGSWRPGQLISYLKRVPSCLSPHRPPILWPVPPLPAACVQPGQLVGSWGSFVEMEVVPAAAFVCGKLEFARTSCSSPPSTWSLPRTRLVILDWRDPTRPSPGSQACLLTPHFRVENRENIYLPFSSLFSMWIANVNHPLRFLYRLWKATVCPTMDRLGAFGCPRAALTSPGSVEWEQNFPRQGKSGLCCFFDCFIYWYTPQFIYLFMGSVFIRHQAIYFPLSNISPRSVLSAPTEHSKWFLFEATK